MARVVLIEASPSNPATGAAVPVRLAGGGSRPYTHLGFGDWMAGVANLPRFTAELGFDENGWNGGAIPQTSDMRFVPALGSTFDALSAYFWNKAPITVKVGDDAVANPVFTTVLTGAVANADATDGVLTITIGDMSVALDKPVAPDRFAGSGGLEGGDDAAQRIKRRSWGRVWNVEGRLLDKANSIYEFGDPGRPLQQFVQLRDKGRPGPITTVAWAGSASATLDALRAATAPQGGGAVAPSIACAKWWTTPSGPLTADLLGEIGSAYIETVPEIAARVVAERSTLTIGNLAEAISLRGAPAGLHVDTDTETVANVLDRILQGVSLLWVLDPAGVIQISEWKFGGGSAGMTWTGTGSGSPTWSSSGGPAMTWGPSDGEIETLVSERVARKRVYPPIGSRVLGYKRNQRIQSEGEISAAVLAADTFYDDGTPVSDLQPAEGGATISRSIYLSESAVVIYILSSGSPASGQLPHYTRASMISGSINVSSQTEWSVSSSPGISANINNNSGDPGRGVVEITQADQNGEIVITGIHGGVTVTQTITLQRLGALASQSSVSMSVIEANSVTRSVGVASASAMIGSRSPPSTVFSPFASYTLTIPPEANSAAIFIFMNGSQSFSALADYGARITIDGSVIGESSAGADNAATTFSRQAVVGRGPGTYLIQASWRGSNGIRLEAGASLIVFVAYR